MTEDNIQGTLIYDGTCGICTKLAKRWEGYLAKLAIKIAAYQSEEITKLLNTDPELAPTDIILLLKDGRQFNGPDAYRYIFKLKWLTFPVYAASLVPGPSHIFDWGYRTFADNRHRFSNSCGLKP